MKGSLGSCTALVTVIAMQIFKKFCRGQKNPPGLERTAGIVTVNAEISPTLLTSFSSLSKPVDFKKLCSSTLANNQHTAALDKKKIIGIIVDITSLRLWTSSRMAKLSERASV
mmetsp:Transcript_28669/g.37577  ORF Transcript_28669/g.37577 Transcript_28669/m.37577 type:complete len:113 (+) Transcript_28669:678-1016(+)